NQIQKKQTNQPRRSLAVAAALRRRRDGDGAEPPRAGVDRAEGLQRGEQQHEDGGEEGEQLPRAEHVAPHEPPRLHPPPRAVVPVHPLHRRVHGRHLRQPHRPAHPVPQPRRLAVALHPVQHHPSPPQRRHVLAGVDDAVHQLRVPGEHQRPRRRRRLVGDQVAEHHLRRAAVKRHHGEVQRRRLGVERDRGGVAVRRRELDAGGGELGD
ncbi:Os06g0179400, partial [Oryza sativa Japonica Group]